MNTLRPELTALSDRLMTLPLDERGYPVPWFVKWMHGKPEFRLMDEDKWIRAVKERLCWVCGHKLGQFLCFVLGPMCGISRTTSEPPCHQECARWSALNCPFLARPHMIRREDGLPEESQSMGGISIKRNPGVTLLWLTHSFKVFKPEQGGILITVGPPIQVEWWAEGKPATREQVEESVRTGLPHLEEVAREQEGAMEALRKETAMLEEMYPA